MSEPRKKLFGPLLYAALLAWGLVAIFAGVETVGPRFQEWLRNRGVIRNLRSTNLQTRLFALEHLEAQDLEPARPYVIEALRDPVGKVRVAAIRVLANQGAELQRLMPVLGAAVDDENPEVRLEAAACLGRLSAHLARPGRHPTGESPEQETELAGESVAILCRLLKDSSSDVRAEAARSLALTRAADSAGPPLVAAAGDPDRGVRMAIAEALLQLNGPDDATAAKLLCDLIADPDPVADRPQILRVLQRTSETTQDRAMGVLAELLARVDPAVLPDVIACLGEAGPRARAALPALEKLLDDREPGTRAAAVMAILAMDGAGPGMVGMGMAAISPSPMMGGGMAAGGASTATRLAAKPSPRVLAVLLEMVTEKELPQDWRSDAFGRLKELAPAMVSKATPGLIVQLGDPSADVRRAALELLQMIVEDTRAEMPGPAAAK